MLTKSWNNFATLCKNKGQLIFGNILTRFEPTLKDNYEISFGIEHNSSEMEFLSRKGELLDYLRVQLNNYHLTIVTEKAEVSSEHILYTNRDKYNNLSEKQPELKDFLKKFDLEVDF